MSTAASQLGLIANILGSIYWSQIVFVLILYRIAQRFGIKQYLARLFFLNTLPNQALQTWPHTEKHTQICKHQGNQLEAAHCAPQEMYTEESVIQFGMREREAFKAKKVVPLTALQSSPHTCFWPAHTHSVWETTNGKQLKIWFYTTAAAWEGVMHIQGSLWKPVEGWMCGSFRPGDLSSTVKTYKYLGSDREDSSWRQTVPIYEKACSRTQHKKNTPVLSQARNMDQKKCEYIQQTPAHKATETPCTEAIFVLRPHALMQFFRGDRVQSLQIDWSIFITAPLMRKQMFLPPFHG